MTPEYFMAKSRDKALIGKWKEYVVHENVVYYESASESFCEFTQAGLFKAFYKGQEGHTKYFSILREIKCMC